MTPDEKSPDKVVPVESKIPEGDSVRISPDVIGITVSYTHLDVYKRQPP